VKNCYFTATHFTTCLFLNYRQLGVKLDLRHKRTEGRTDKRWESNLMHFSLKMWHLVAII